MLHFLASNEDISFIYLILLLPLFVLLPLVKEIFNPNSFYAWGREVTTNSEKFSSAATIPGSESPFMFVGNQQRLCG